LGSVGVVALATASPSGAQPACTDNWIGPNTGTTNWGASASDWSSGIPNGSSVACVAEAGTYSVVFTNDAQAPDALEIGGATSGTQTVEINGANMSTGEDNEVENGGVLSLVPSASTVATLSGETNSLTVDAGGTLDSSGSSSQLAAVSVNLDNQGTTTFSATSNEIDNTTTTNEGSLTVSAGASLNETAASFTDASGTLTNDGSFIGHGSTFTQSGTTESGNPVLQDAGTFVDSAGTGSFEAYQTTLEGIVPVGQTLTNLASPGNSNDTIGTSSTGVTVDGTLVCADASGSPNDTICSLTTPNPTWPGITVAAGGTLETTGPSGATPSSCGGDQCVNLGVNIQIESGGTATIANAYTLDNSTQITNDGTLQVTAAGYLVIGGNTVVDSGGTIGVTDGAYPLGLIDVTSGYSFTCSTLAVDTVGSPVSETVISTPSGNGCVFSNFSFGPDYYTVSQTTTTVALTPATPFSPTPTSFTPAEGEAITPQTATFDTNGEPGTYSATVNYGDGTGTQSATVNVSGISGTVIGPTHTYTAPGTHTVTTTISTTAGTTITVTESVTVTGPTITGLSKSTIKPGKKLTVVVSGTDFDGTAAPNGFSTSDPTNLSVVSAKFVAATKKKPADYKVKLKAAKTAPNEQVSLILTQTGSEAGQTTRTDAIEIS
jgi:hypothetical protein